MQIKRILTSITGCLIIAIAHAQFSASFDAQAGTFNAFRLTEALNGQRGSIWNETKISLDEPFDYTFELYFGDLLEGADGIVFAFQPIDANLGGDAQGIGIAGVNPSLFVEMDTWNNTGLGDTETDHIAIGKNGDVSHLTENSLDGPVDAIAGGGEIENGEWHSLRIVWDPVVQHFAAYFNCDLRVEYTGDIVNEIFGGDPMVFYGFTAATGGFNNEHRVRVPYEDNLPDTLEDYRICTGSSVQMDIPAGTNWTWTTLNGDPASISDPNTDQPILSPTETTTYIGNFEYLCEPRVDSLTVYVADQFEAEITTPPQTMCLGDDSVEVMATPNGGYYSGLGISDTTSGWWNNNTAGLGKHWVKYTLTDGNCSNSDSVLMTVNGPPVSNIPNDTICPGETAALSAQAGADSYLWAPADGLDNTNQASVSASPATSTDYQVTITLENCSTVDTIHVEVAIPPLANIEAPTTICESDTAEVIGTGGTSYAWNVNGENLTGDTLRMALNTSTNYTVTVTNGGDCYSTAATTVEVNPSPTPVLSGPDAICEGESATFNATGGEEYIWQLNTVLAAAETDNQISFIPTTNTRIYTTVTDANGCSDTTSAFLYINDKPIADPGENDTICFGESIALTAVSGAAFYNWEPANILSSTNTNSTTALPATSTWFSVTVSDGNCAGIDSVHIAVLALPELNVAPYDAKCEGQMQTLTASGAADYFWSYNGDQTSIDNPLTFVPAQVQVIELTGVGENSCSAELNVPIDFLAAATATVSNPVSICAGDTLNLTASGGSVIEWIDPAFVVNINQGELTVAPEVTTDYAVVVTTAGGCKDSALTRVSITNELDVDIEAISPICTGDTVTLTASGGSTFTWDADPALFNTVGATTRAIPMNSQWFYATGSSAGCSASDSVYIEVFDKVIANISSDTMVCEGTANFDLETDVVGGFWTGFGIVDSISGTFDPDAAAIGKNAISYIIAGSCPTANGLIINVNRVPEPAISGPSTLCNVSELVSYTATPLGGNWSGAAVLSSDTGLLDASTLFHDETTYISYNVSVNGCAASDSIAVTMSRMELELPSDTTVCVQQQQNITLSPLASNGNNYLWSNGTEQPSLNVSRAGTYSLTISDDSGCAATEEVVVINSCACDMFIPSAFSPNDDGKNEVFTPVVSDESLGFEMTIFDRWGEVVFESTSTANSWNGHFRNEPATSDVYVVSATCGSSDYLGRVTLVR